MKLLTKEEEAEHYNQVLKGGALGGFAGLGLGAAGVFAASRRYQFFRQLTIPLRAFFITSAGTFAGIISADHFSRAYERSRNQKDVEYQQREKEKHEAEIAGKTFTQRALDFGKKERYKIVGASWIASMIAAFTLVNRNKYLTGQQKLVQARVYAQFLTVGVLVASAAFEISDKNNETGRYETVKIIDPSDPEHKRIIERQKEVEGDSGDELWKDMVAAEEQRLKERGEEAKRYRKSQEKKSGGGDKKKSGSGEKKEGKDDADKKKDDGGDKKQEKKDGGDKKQEKKDDSKDSQKQKDEGEQKSEKKDESKDKKKS